MAGGASGTGTVQRVDHRAALWDISGLCRSAELAPDTCSRSAVELNNLATYTSPRFTLAGCGVNPNHS
eukprot:SAG31_NODE_37153_length_306_cov_1.942029_1_plen_67_part_01